MRNVYIHPGLHKTGTTVLQKEIFEKTKDIHYLHNWDLNVKIPDTKVVISMEWLTGRPHGVDPHFNEVVTTAKNLNKIFPNAKIILGTRKEKNWLKSLYSQHIKEGGILRYDEWKSNLPDEWKKMENYVNLYKNYFPEVFVYRFSDIKNNFVNIIEQICEFVEIDVPEAQNRVYNKAFSPKKLETMRRINMFFKSEYNKKGIIPAGGKEVRGVIKTLSGSWTPSKK